MNIKNLIQLILVLSLGFALSCEDEKPGSAEAPRIISTGNPTVDGLSAKIMAHPNDAKLFAERAVAYFEIEGYDEAIADMANALRLDSMNISYHHLLADVYLEYYKSNQAIMVLERAVSLDPQNIESLLKLAEFQLILKQHDPSIKTIDRILKINENNASAFLLMGMNFEQIGDEARAINSYQTAIENDPSMAQVHMKLGQIFAKKKNDIALRYFENAVAAAPNDPVVLYAKAEYLHNTDQLDEALEVLKQAVVKDHQFVDAFFRSGVIYLEKDSLQKAHHQFDLVIQNDPASAKGFYYRGLAAELKGEPAKAKNDYEQALVFAPEYQKAKEALDRLTR